MEEKLKALLVGVNVNNEPDFDKSLEELENLTEACDMEVVGVETQNVNQVNSGVYMGTGKVEEVKAIAHMLEADIIVFNNTLSPKQLRNLRDAIERPIMDRTNLILRIFSSRARTKEAQIQVETARLQYELPRLTGMGEVLSRQGGDGGAGYSNRGAGETKLELDRRRIRERIAELRRELKDVEKNRDTQRKQRLEQGVPQVALVGYTNAGKSTLMNAMLDRYEQNEEKKVFVQDMLFATLDTTVRSIRLPDKKEFLLSDTVGFINQLPHNLVQAFHSTLEEVKYADLLLEVIDYSDENYKDHIKVTENTLKELGAGDIPCIRVYNKCDETDEAIPRVNGEEIYMAAKGGIGLEELVQMICTHIFSDYVDCVMMLPYAQGALLSYFNENATVKNVEYLAEGTKVTMSCPLKDLQKYKQYVLL